MNAQVFLGPPTSMMGAKVQVTFGKGLVHLGRARTADASEIFAYVSQER